MVIIMADNILEIKNLKKYFKLKDGLFAKTKIVRALDNVSFNIPRG